MTEQMVERNMSKNQWAVPFGKDPFVEDDAFVPSTEFSLVILTENTEISRDAWFRAMCEDNSIDHTDDQAVDLLEGMTSLRADQICGFWVVDEAILRLCSEIWVCSPKFGDDATIAKMTKRLVSRQAYLTISFE